MLPKLENKTQTGTIAYIVLLIINCSTYVYNIYTLYSVQQNKAYARLNIARQQSQCSAAIWHGTKHVSDASSTASTHLCLHVILKNHAKSQLDSNIFSNLWVIEANYKSHQIEICKPVLIGVCCKHFIYTCMHRSCTLSWMHVECTSTYFVISLLFNVQNSVNIFF